MFEGIFSNLPAKPNIFVTGNVFQALRRIHCTYIHSTTQFPGCYWCSRGPIPDKQVL